MFPPSRAGPCFRLVTIQQENHQPFQSNLGDTTEKETFWTCSGSKNGLSIQVSIVGYYQINSVLVLISLCGLRGETQLSVVQDACTRTTWGSPRTQGRCRLRKGPGSGQALSFPPSTPGSLASSSTWRRLQFPALLWKPALSAHLLVWWLQMGIAGKHLILSILTPHKGSDA